MENNQHQHIIEHQSHVINTLHRQIQALTPIRVSHHNLLNYHHKISLDLASLIDQHDFAISSLKSNVQNLSTIALRTEGQRNDLSLLLKDIQNQYAKLVLDTRNMAQKYQTLNQKLQLQSNRTQQNINYKNQLLSIQQTLQSHILNVQTILKQLQIQKQKTIQEQQIVKTRTQTQTQRKQTLIEQNQRIKQKIAKINIKNDDLIDGNKKLSEQIKAKQQLYMQTNRRNRQLKQKTIQLKSNYQKINNQIDYKLTLLTSQNNTNAELTLHYNKLSNLIQDLQTQKSLVQKDNQNLSNQIVQMTNTLKQNTLFKLNSQNHLAQLKKTNQLLMIKMEQCCQQDKQVQNLLLRKMASLQYFAKLLNQKYQFQQSNKIQTVIKQSLFKQKSTNIDKNTKINEFTFLQRKFSQLQVKKVDSKIETKSSDKSWLKQNVC